MAPWHAQLCLVAVLTSAGNVIAAGPAPAVDPDDVHPVAASEPFRPAVDAPVGLGVGLDAHGGIQGLFTGENKSRALVGGTLRGRFHYFQVGGTLEQGDSGTATGLFERPEESFSAYSGFVGVVLPFERWIDADASVGLGIRRYDNPSPRYGAKGFVYETPSLTWRLGVSDRTSEKLFGVRVGGGFFGAFDLKPGDVGWETTLLATDGTTRTVTGSTPVGGVSFGLVFSVGLEVGGVSETRGRN